MDNTFLDVLVECPTKAIAKIGKDKDVAALLLDKANVDMTSDEADDIFDKYIFDYGYVDGSTSEAEAFICVEAETGGRSTPAVRGFRLYVTIICHKNYMKIDPRKLPGMVGNRRDNLTRIVDNILNGADLCGIGALILDSVKTVASPTGFAARELTYRLCDFNAPGARGL